MHVALQAPRVNTRSVIPRHRPAALMPLGLQKSWRCLRLRASARTRPERRSFFFVSVDKHITRSQTNALMPARLFPSRYVSEHNSGGMAGASETLSRQQALVCQHFFG